MRSLGTVQMQTVTSPQEHTDKRTKQCTKEKIIILSDKTEPEWCLLVVCMRASSPDSVPGRGDTRVWVQKQSRTKGKKMSRDRYVSVM